MLLPQIKPARLALKVRPSVEKIIRRGHPWIFEDAISKQNAEGKAGDMAIIFDNKKNKLLAIGLYDPHSPIRVKVLQNSPAQINADWFASKIQGAFRIRQPLLTTDTNSYRLINGENDGLPSFIADVYADVLVVKLYSFIWLPYLEILFPILLKTTGCQHLVLRLSRNLQKEPDLLHGLTDGQVVFGNPQTEEIIFTEYGLQFNANVIKGHKTGYFLDHRDNRRKIGLLAKNKSVLDIFAYAGGFSVHALGGGATRVVSLDISKQALGMARRNVALNFETPKHECLAIDAFEGMEKLYQEGERFDIVVVDPPSFAKSNAEREKALHSYTQLAKLAIPLVAKNGILLLASCSSRVSADDFFETVIPVVEASNRYFQEMERTFHDIDHPIGFPEGAYLKAVYFRLDVVF